jgi:hypothetical protein
VTGWHPGGVTDQERYHLTLFAGARPVIHGYWAARETADRKFTRWIGEHGGVAGARVVLVDEVEQRVLASWPDGAPRLAD